MPNAGITEGRRGADHTCITRPSHRGSRGAATAARLHRSGSGGGPAAKEPSRRARRARWAAPALGPTGRGRQGRRRPGGGGARDSRPRAATPAEPRGGRSTTQRSGRTTNWAAAKTQTAWPEAIHASEADTVRSRTSRPLRRGAKTPSLGRAVGSGRSPKWHQQRRALVGGASDKAERRPFRGSGSRQGRTILLGRAGQSLQVCSLRQAGTGPGAHREGAGRVAWREPGLYRLTGSKPQ